MAVKSIQLGQVWRSDDSGQNYLVTKIYNEVFSQYAILRMADSSGATAETIRLKIQKEGGRQNLPGYTYTQESQEF